MDQSSNSQTQIAGRRHLLNTFAGMALASLIPTRTKAKGNRVDAASLRSYGAKGDGRTDDSDALAQALTHSERVYVGPGVFLCANVPVPEGRELFGIGTLKLKALQTRDLSPILNLQGSNISISGITFHGNRRKQPNDGFADAWDTGPRKSGKKNRAAICADGAEHDVSNVSITKCKFREVWGASVAARNVSNLEVSSCTFTQNNFEAVFAHSTIGVRNLGLRLFNNYCHTIGSGHSSVNANAFAATNYDGLTVAGNQVFGIERNLIKIVGCSLAIIDGNLVDGNSSESFSAIQIQAGGRLIKITNNIIKNVQKGIHIQTGFIEHIHVAANMIDGAYAHHTPDGIAVIGAKHVSIHDNMLTNIGRHGIVLLDASQVSIRRNTVLRSSSSPVPGAGVCLREGEQADDVHIEGNVIRGFETKGSNAILVDNLTRRTSSVRIHDNHFPGLTQDNVDLAIWVHPALTNVTLSNNKP
jgi:parallel beta-helix repeat protein